ncbi:spermatogenesis-associated protein 22 [Heteronotia binoei]|uniref:spermatogenesis-associated protein 22 n=1 Tax=Heteronotia binoei TaxID=13085 RepID=UPI00292FFF44|nr:spermatogenesis-associated protein 22 [Heteronotia binoei]
MKRNFTDNSTRTTAGCLPVPLFNQKKRTRQPLTSNPLKNEPSASSTAETLDLSTMLADFGWEVAKPEPTQLQKTTGIDPTELSMPSPLLKQQTPSKSIESSTGRNVNNWRLARGKKVSSDIWKRNDCVTFGCRTENRKIPKLEYGSSYLPETGSRQKKLPGPPKASQNISTGTAGQSYSSTVQQLGLPNIMPRSQLGTSYMVRHNPQQQKVNEKKADHIQGDKMIQKAPSCQLRMKEKDRSLRILSVVIESMKHWSQYTNKTPLLFEVLGILDSAVTPGLYSAKTFLLRDGKESVSCVFYEIDRELPRLIRGRAHRCVGNYDTSRKLFRCVSVRPASVPEQQTFQDFVRIADVEMGEYVKASNEV